MRVFLDNAATTPMSEEVIQAMIPIMREQFGNPSSIHADGRKVRATIEEARKKIANYIGASIGEVFFTSGGTESNNMALKCAVRDLGVTRIISSPIEHHCVLHSLESLEKTGIHVDLVKVRDCGMVDLDHLTHLLSNSDQKTLVSIMHANNEIGTLQDIERISDLCHEHNALFHSDTVQTIGHFPIDVSKLKISFLSGSAHKFHGPKGAGFIYINSDNILKPFIDGGSQERNMRAGTENVIGIVGLAKAMELACDHMEAHRNHIESIRDYFKTQLKENFVDIQFNGNPDHYLYTVLSVSFPPSPSAALLLLSLDIAGISASGGSACSSGAEKGSHVLAALNSDPERKSIRFSFSHYTTKDDIDFVISKLKTLVKTKEALAVE